MRLQGKTAIVTGAGSGIGRAIALRFAREGANVVAVDWNAQSLAACAAAIGEEGGRAAAVHADVSKSGEVQAAVRAAEENYGRLDILVNNAAIQILGRLEETSEEDWDRLQAVNLKGVFLCTKYAIPVLRRSGGGAIVNIASILGLVGDPDLAAYCAMKGGVLALTRAAALSYGPEGIRVNAICPGDVDTPMVREYFAAAPDPAALRAEVASKYALRRISTPEEIASAALFLASEESSFMTASTVVIDGGLTARCY
jgi:NAD(P)-dependent dehydrogenase (short-subunit alcohol dehydrogenase family)